MAALQDDNDFLDSVEDIESNIMVIDKPDESTDSQSEQFEVDLSSQEFSGTGFSKSTEKCVKFAVSLLKAWCVSNGESADIEKMTFAELNEILGKFYSNVRTKTGEYYSYSSLTSFRYSLNRYFQSMAEGKRFDIIENSEFFNSNEIFSTVIKSLKLKSTDKGDKNKLFLTSDELRQIYLQVFAEDSPKTLQYKVWFEVAVYFNKGGRSKQRILTKNCFIFGNDAFGKFVFLKKDTGSDSSMNSNKDGRKMYEKRNHPLCPVLSLAKYLSKLHPETMDLFQRPKYKISKSASVWYYHQPVGKNFLGNVMYLICTQAGISKQVSNKCLKNITPEVLDACVFSIPLNRLGIPKSVGVPAIMELKKRSSTKQASSTVSQMDRFAAGDSSSQSSDIYETHGPKITYEEAKQEIQSLFQRLTPKVLSDVMLWLKNVDFSKDITGELICEDNSHFVTSQVQYNNSILSRGFQPNTYQLPPSQLPLSLNYTLPRYPLTPIPLKTVGPYNNMPQPSSVPRPFHPAAQNFVYNYSNRGLCSSLSTPVSSILPPPSLHHNPAQIGIRIPHEVNVNNHNYNMGGNSSVEPISPQNIPPPAASHGRVLSPTFISSPFNYSNSTTLLNLNNNPNPNETALETSTKHTWSTIPANLQTNQTGDGNTWPGNDVRHGKVKKASKQKKRRRLRRRFSEEIGVHREMLQRELPVVFPWLETNGNPYEYMYFIQGREQLQGHMNTLVSNANNQGHVNTPINNANNQGYVNTPINIANNQGHVNTHIYNANDQGHKNTPTNNANDKGYVNKLTSYENDQGHMNTPVNANYQGHMNTLTSNANEGHAKKLTSNANDQDPNDPENVNMFVSNVSRQVDNSDTLVNNITSFEPCPTISKGKNSEIKRKSNSSETETSNQASNFGTPILKKSKNSFESKTPEPNFRIVSVVSMSDVPENPRSMDLSMYKTDEAKKYFNYLGLDLVHKKQISRGHDFQNQNNSNSIHQQQLDFQKLQHPQNKEFKAIDNFQSDQDFTRYCTADKDGFLIKVTIDKQNCLPVCSRCEFKITRKIKKYGRNFCHKICHHLDKDIAYYEALNQNEIFDVPRQKAQDQDQNPLPKVDDLSVQSPEPENLYSPISNAEAPDDDPLGPRTEAKENTETHNTCTKELKSSDHDSITPVADDTRLEFESLKAAENNSKPIQIDATEFSKPIPPLIKGNNADNTIYGNKLPKVQNLKTGLRATTEEKSPSPCLTIDAALNKLPARTESDTSIQVNQGRLAISPDLTETKSVINENLSSRSNGHVKRNKDQSYGNNAEDSLVETVKRIENNKVSTYPSDLNATDSLLTEPDLTWNTKENIPRTKSESSTTLLSRKEQPINIAQIKEDLFLSDEETKSYIPDKSVQHDSKDSCQLQEDLYLSESDALSQESIQACEDQKSINKNPSCDLAVLPMDDNGMTKPMPLKSISDERLINKHTDKTVTPNQALNVEHRSNQSPKEDQIAKDKSFNAIGTTRNLEQGVLELDDNHVSPAVITELQRDIASMPEWIKLSQVIKESKDSQAGVDRGPSGSGSSTKIHGYEGRGETRPSARHAFRQLKTNMLIRKLQRKKKEYLQMKLIKIRKERELMQLDETVAKPRRDSALNNESRQKSSDKVSAKEKVLVSLPLKHFDGKLQSKNLLVDHNESYQDNDGLMETNKDDRRPDCEENIVMNEDPSSDNHNPTQKRSIQAEIKVKDRFSSQNSPNCSSTLDKVADNVTVENIHIVMSKDLKRHENVFVKAAEGEPEDLGMEKSKDEQVSEELQCGSNGTEMIGEDIYQAPSADENELNDVDPCFLNKSVALIFTPEEGSPMKNKEEPEKPMEQPLTENIENTGSNRDRDVLTKDYLSVNQINDAESRSDQKAPRDTEEEKNILGHLKEAFAHETDTSKSSKDDTDVEKHPSRKNLETKCYFVNPIYKSILNRKLLDIKNSEFVKKLKSGSRETPLSKEEMILKINKCFNEAKKQRKQNEKKLEASKADNVTVADERRNSHIDVADQIKSNSFENPGHDDPSSLSQFRTKEDSVMQQKSGNGIRKDKTTPMISEANVKERKTCKYSVIRIPLEQPESKPNSAKSSNPVKKPVEEGKSPHKGTVSSQNVPEKDQTSGFESRDDKKTAESLFGTSIKAEKLSPETAETQPSKRMHYYVPKKRNKLKFDNSKEQTPNKIFIKEEPVSPNAPSSMTPQVSHPDQTKKAPKNSPTSPVVKLTKDLNSTALQEKRLIKMGKSGITGTSATPFQTGSKDQTGPVSNISQTSSNEKKENIASGDNNEGQYQQKNKATAVEAYPNSIFPCINGGAFRPVQRTISSDLYPPEDQNHFQAQLKKENNGPQNYQTSSGPTSIQSGKASQVNNQIATKQFLGMAQAPKPSQVNHTITSATGIGTKNHPEIIRPQCMHPHLRMNYQPTLNPDCHPRIPSFRPLHLPDNTSRLRVPAEMLRMYAPRFQQIPHSNSNMTTVGNQYPVLHSRLAQETSRKDNTVREIPRGQYTIASLANANIVKGIQISLPITSVPQVQLKEQSKQNCRPGTVLPPSKRPPATVIKKAKPSSSSYTIHDFENLNPWNSEENQTTSTNQTPLKSPKVLSKKAYLMKRSTNPGVLSKAAKPVAKKSPLQPNSTDSTVQLSKVQKYFQNKLSNLFKTSINVTKVTDAKGQPVTPTKLMQGQVPVYIRYERRESGQRKTSIIMGKQNRPSSTDMDFYDLESAQIAFQKFQKDNRQKGQLGSSQVTKTSSNLLTAKTASNVAKTGHLPKDKHQPASSTQADKTISNARTQLTKQLLPAQTSTNSLQTKLSTITSGKESTRAELGADPLKLNVKRTPSKKKRKKAKIIYNANANDQHSETFGNPVMDKTNKEKHTKKRIVLQECIEQIHEPCHYSEFPGKGKDPLSTKKSLNKENGVVFYSRPPNSSTVSSKTLSSTQHGGQILKIKQRCTQSTPSNRATYTIAQRDAIMNAISAYFQHRTSGKVKNTNVCPSSNSESSSTTKVLQQTPMNRTNSNPPPKQSTSEISVKPTKVVWPLGFDARKASSESDLSKVVHVKPIRRPRKQVLTPMADYKGSDYLLTSRTTEDGAPLDLSLTKTKHGAKVAVDPASSDEVSQDMHIKPTSNVRLEVSECSTASKSKSEEPVLTTNDILKVVRKAEDASSSRNITPIPNSRNITTIPASRELVAITKQPSRDPRTVKRRVPPEASTIVATVYPKCDNSQQNQRQQKGQNEIQQKCYSHLVPTEKPDVTIHSTNKVTENYQQTLVPSKAGQSPASSSKSSKAGYYMGEVPLHNSKACTNLLENKDNLTDKEALSSDEGGNLNSFSPKDGLNRSDLPNHIGTLSTDGVGVREVAPFEDFQGSAAYVFKLKPCSVVINKDLIYPSEFKIKNNQAILDKHLNEPDMSRSADDGSQSMEVEEHDDDDDIFDSQTTQILGDSRPSEEDKTISKRKRHQTESFSITTKKNNKLLLRIKLGDHHKMRKRKKHNRVEKDDDFELRDTDDEENVRDQDSENHHPIKTYQSDAEL